MINAILGDLVSVKGQVAILRGGYVEYSLVISGQTESKLASLVGEQKRNVRLLAVLSHHQDSMLLYGFYDELEREAFNQLQSVSGIGPKQALKILSGITVENLAKALDEGNLKLLSSIPGIGAKTGQKMILQLRDVLVLEEQDHKGEEKQNRIYQEVVNGLVEMGYERKSSEDVVAKMESEHKEELDKLSLRDKEEFVFKHALVYLG